MLSLDNRSHASGVLPIMTIAPAKDRCIFDPRGEKQETEESLIWFELPNCGLVNRCQLEHCSHL